ncbi:hypothetical protein SNEBB_006035 [Seison nebaliae]|nr:hypothetical protein SNEBB_006035 [Seison nebaliae]
MIGALFSIHDPPTTPSQRSDRLCSSTIREQYGIQRVEAARMLWKEINDPINGILKSQTGFTMGIEIRDTCWFSSIALEQAIEFIRNTLMTIRRQPLTVRQKRLIETRLFTRLTRDIRMNMGNNDMKPIVGVIGPGSSDATIYVQSLLQLFNIPQIGFSATSLELSTKEKFPYFLRVISSDNMQAQAIADILYHFNWTYIYAVGTQGSYGEKGIEALQHYASEKNVCLANANQKPLIVDSASSSKVYDEIIKKVQQQKNCKIIVCFCQGEAITKLLEAKEKLEDKGRNFKIIGSDGWADRLELIKDFDEAAHNSISVKVTSAPVARFQEYYSRLKPEIVSPMENPWFNEFWTQKFNCTPTDTNCRKKQLPEISAMDPKLGFVMNAILAMAHGLKNMHTVLCKEKGKPCEQMQVINGTLLRDMLMKVNFAGVTNDMIHFDPNGDPPGKYDILSYQSQSDKFSDNYSNGKTRNKRLGQYKLIGVWDSQLPRNYRLILNDFIRNLTVIDDISFSRCSEECKFGEKRVVSEAKCCWSCEECERDEYLENSFTCRKCPIDQIPHVNMKHCIKPKITYLQWHDVGAIISLIFATWGIILSLFIAIIFAIHNNTSIVKSTTRELSYIIIGGTFICYICTIFMLAEPHPFLCTINRSLPSIAFSMIYGALVTKTNRILRILQASKKIRMKKLNCVSLTSQIIITLFIISIELSIIVVVLYIEPPIVHYRMVFGKKNTINNEISANLSIPYFHDEKIMECKSTKFSVLVPLSFDFFLLFMCTLYAIKTRNVPENFNEAKFIGFSTYTTWVIWIAFIIIYFTSDNNKIVTLCICVSLSAYVVLIILFCPKCYIILYRPEKNQRAAFATAKGVRCHIGASTSNLANNSTVPHQSNYLHIRKLSYDSKLFRSTSLKRPIITSYSAKGSLQNFKKKNLSLSLLKLFRIYFQKEEKKCAETKPVTPRRSHTINHAFVNIIERSNSVQNPYFPKQNNTTQSLLTNTKLPIIPIRRNSSESRLQPITKSIQTEPTSLFDKFIHINSEDDDYVDRSNSFDTYPKVYSQGQLYRLSELSNLPDSELIQLKNIMPNKHRGRSFDTTTIENDMTSSVFNNSFIEHYPKAKRKSHSVRKNRKYQPSRNQDLLTSILHIHPATDSSIDILNEPMIFNRFSDHCTNTSNTLNYARKYRT